MPDIPANGGSIDVSGIFIFMLFGAAIYWAFK
jgi:hypothetical protein